MMKSAVRRMKTPSLILLVLLIVTVAFVNLYLGYKATISSTSFINKNTEERDADNTSKKNDYKKEQPQQQKIQNDNDRHSRKDHVDSNTDDDDDESFYTNPNSLEALRTIPTRICRALQFDAVGAFQ